MQLRLQNGEIHKHTANAVSDHTTYTNYVTFLSPNQAEQIKITAILCGMQRNNVIKT